MTESSNTSKNFHSQNSFNLVDSKKSLRTNNSKEQSDIDENIHNIITSNFDNENLNVINENINEGELQITDSILMELDDEISVTKEGLNSPMELDLQGIDFGEILKSQVKSNSPLVFKRNFQHENKTSVKNFQRDHVNFGNNLSYENNLVLKEEDIESLLENMNSEVAASEQIEVSIMGKAMDRQIIKKEKEWKIMKKLQVYRAVSLCYPSLFTRSFNEIVPVDPSRNNNLKICHSASTTSHTSLNETVGDINSNTYGNNSLDRFHTEFQNLLRSSQYFYSFYQEKIQEMDRIKTQVEKLESVFKNLPRCASIQNQCCRCPNSNFPHQFSNFNNNNSNNNFSHENGLKLFTNEIKIVLSTNNEQKSPGLSMSYVKNNREFFSQMEELEALNLNLNSNNIISQINQINNSMNNIIPQGNYTQDNSRSGFKIPMELNRGDTNRVKAGDKILGDLENVNRNSISTANTFITHDKNLKKFEENKKKNITSRNELISVKDDELDEIVQKISHRNKILSGSSINEFVSGKRIDGPNKKIEENFDSSGCDINSSIDMKNINDEEFDQILKNLKKGKKINVEGNGFTTGNNLGNINKSEFAGSNMIGNYGNIDNFEHNFDNTNTDLNFNEIDDAEFDNILNGLKNKKLSTKTSGLNIEFSKSNNLSKLSNQQFLERKNSIIASDKKMNTDKSTTATYTSDFICNNNPMQYKTNQRVLKLMSEMEKETGEGLCDIQEEEIEQRVKKGKILLNNNTILSKPEVGIKRNFDDHIKSLSNGVSIDESNRPKKIQKTGQGFKIEKKESSGFGGFNSTSNKTTMMKLANSSLTSNNIGQAQSILDLSKDKNISFRLKNLKEKIKQIKEQKLESIYSTDKCEFLCVCMDIFLEISPDQITEEKLSHCLEDSCRICGDKKSISIDNYPSAFTSYFTLGTLYKSPEKEKETLTFFRYQYRYVSWKYHLISKLSEKKNEFSLPNLFNHIYKKYKIIYEEGRRSFLTKVAEKDSSINKYMTLHIFSIKKTKEIKSSNVEYYNYTLELTDGYKSIYSEIPHTNPISSLIHKNIIYPGMKLHIGLAKIEKVTEDFEIFIQIYYNSISKADMSTKLGQSKDKKFLIKNLANIRDDGGEVSLIDVIVLKKYDYYVFDFNKKKKFSRGKFEKIIEKANEEAEKRHIYSLHKEDVYNITDDEDNEPKKRNKKINGKNVRSENLNNVKGLKRLNAEKNYNQRAKKEDEINFNNQDLKSPYEGISYTFKIICVDSLLYLNYLNEIEKNSCKENFDKNVKKSLKSKLMKKCVIEFQTKNLNPFENIITNNRYQFALLNKSKNNFNSFDTKNLKLKANDSTLIKEIKLEYKKSDLVYQNFLGDLNKCRDIKNEEIDVSEFLLANNFNYSKIYQEEFSFTGIYLNRYVCRKINPGDDSNKDSEKFLFFMNKDSCLAIIKVHDEDFFDMTKFTKSNFNSNQIFQFSNLNFQILYYFENFSTKNLTTFKEEKLYDKNFANKYVVLFMETTHYTNFKIASSSAKHFIELKNKITESIAGKNKIYDEALLDDVTKSI